jgi:hypothetical protein
MQMKRFAHLTIAQSKPLANHCATVSLWINFYNLCRVHEALRCTPAMSLGVTDHIWSVAELVHVAFEPSDVPPLPDRTPQPTLPAGARRLRLIVGRAGKGTNMPHK